VAAQNKLVERITHQKGRIQTMLAPWLRGAPGQSNLQRKKPGQDIPVGLRFKVAARKMRVLDDQHSQFVHPEKTAALGLNLKAQFQNAHTLTHINPKIQRKAAGWSELERVYPKQFGGEPSAPEEPGVMKQGSIIPRFTPTPEQLLASFQTNPRSEATKPAPTPPPAKKAAPQPNLDPRNRLFTRIEEVPGNQPKPAASEPTHAKEPPHPSPAPAPSVQRQMESTPEPAQPKEPSYPSASPAPSVQRQAEPTSEPAEPKATSHPSAAPAPSVQRQAESTFEPVRTLPERSESKTSLPSDSEPSVEPRMDLPLAPQQRQIETHYARRPAILDRPSTSKSPEPAPKPEVKPIPEPQENRFSPEPSEPAPLVGPLPVVKLSPTEPDPIKPVSAEPAVEKPVSAEPARPPVIPGKPAAAQTLPSLPKAAVEAEPIPSTSPTVPDVSPEKAPVVTAKPKPIDRLAPSLDLPLAAAVHKPAPSQAKPAVAKPVSRKPVSFPKVSQRASTPTVSREIDTPAPTSIEPQTPQAEESDQPEAILPGNETLAQANLQPSEPPRWMEAPQRQSPQPPAAVQSSELPPTQPDVLPVGPAPELPSDRLQAKPVDRPAETRQPMPLQKNLQKRLKVGKTYTQREPLNLPIRNSPALPVHNRQNPPLIVPQKYHRVERGVRSTAQTVQREIDPILPPASRPSSMPVVARQPDRHPAPSVAQKPSLPASAPAASFEPAPMDLAYLPAIPSAHESSSPPQSRPAVSTGQAGTGGTVQRFIDQGLKGMASQAVSANTPKAADVGSMAQSALGVNPAQSLSPSSLKSDAKGAAMSALGLGSGGGTDTGGGGESQSGASAQAEAPAAAAPNLEQIAEDVLPILKRLLEIDILRSGG
jgi:hypothetical protein